MRRRGAAVIAVVAVVASALALWWLARGSSGRRTVPAGGLPAPAAGSSSGTAGAVRRGVDLAAFRAQLAVRRAKARELAARHPRAAGERTGPGPGMQSLEPECFLGPADLCATIRDAVGACDDGDAPSCLAVGQYLEDNPPRPMIAVSFFLYACKKGEQAGCDRLAAIKAPPTHPPAPCEDDPVLCAWQATKAADQARLDDACAAGVADACAAMLQYTERDPTRARVYLEASCQLGNPLACEELGRRLTPGCTGDCYPPDPEAAAEASTIACDVGFADACTRLGGTP